MKLTNVLAKAKDVRAKVLGVAGGLLHAGAAMTAGAPAANAQVAFGVTVGPRYYAPAPVPPPVYRPYGYAPGYVGYGYGYGYRPGYWGYRHYGYGHPYWGHPYGRPYYHGWR